MRGHPRRQRVGYDSRRGWPDNIKAVLRPSSRACPAMTRETDGTANDHQHPQRRPGHRRLSRAREGAVRLRPVRARQYRAARRAVRARRRHQDHLGASRDRRGLHGRRLLPRRGPAGRDLHVLRPGLGEPADRARQRLSRFGAVPRRSPATSRPASSTAARSRSSTGTTRRTFRRPCAPCARRCSSRRAATWCRWRCGRPGRRW